MIPDRVSITKRPNGATNRSGYGHFDGDAVVSGKQTGSIAALVVDRARPVNLRQRGLPRSATVRQVTVALKLWLGANPHH